MSILYLLIVRGIRRYSRKLQNISLKLATRTKPNVELQKKAIQISDQKRQLTEFFFWHLREGKSGLTKFPPTHKQRTHCAKHRVAKTRGPHKGGTEGRGTAKSP